MSIRPYILSETNWKSVRDTDYTIALLPWGATEAHNYHMPYATDNIQAEHIAGEAAKLAWGAGTKVIVLPCIPYGVNTGQLDIRLCMNMNPSTQYAILTDIVDVLLRHDIDKLVIINSHGGNNFKNMIREMSIDQPDMYMCSINWWKIGDSNQYFDEPGDHAGELETSILMHVRPDLLLPLSEAGSGYGKSYKLKGLREGWVTGQREWTRVSKDTGVGNPQHATAEKGKTFLDNATREISSFIVELDALDPEDIYVDL